MNKKGVELGLFLIFVGVVFLLVQTGLLDMKIIRFIENHKIMVVAMLLILTGINLVFRKIRFIGAVTWIGFLIALVVFSNFYKYETVIEINSTEKTAFSERKPENTMEGELKLDLGALDFKLGSTDGNLYEGKSVGLDLKHNAKYKEDGDAEVRINAGSSSAVRNIDSLFKTGKIDREAELLINDEVVWEMALEFNAASAQLDMSKLKVEKVKLDGNAGEFKLILGDSHNYTKVNVDANASDVQISVPRNSGIKLDFDGQLSSNDFIGIEMERKDGSYVSKNYKEAENKIDIKADLTVGTLEIIGLK